jgi:hypothetical protein
MHEHSVVMTGRISASDFLKAQVVLGLTLATALICWFVPPASMSGEAGVVMDLPSKVGELYSFPEEVSQAEILILPSDTTFARETYGPILASRNDRILCSIILSGKEKRSIHRPERCLPAQGWHIDDSHTETIMLKSGRPLEVTALLLDKPVTRNDGQPATMRSYYLYWFVGKDVTTASQTDRILRTNWDMLVHRVNQRWAYIIVSANISQDWRPDGLDAQQTLDRLKRFIRDSVPSYMISEMPAGTTPAQ